MKIYYYLSKSKDRRIQLENIDIYALLFLNEQCILSQPQFHEFYSLLKHISDAAFRRKMSRWDNANIINKRKVKMKNGYEMAIINLTPEGQTILKKLGYLGNGEKLKYQAKSNLDHTLSIKQSVIEVLKSASHKVPFYIADGGKYVIPFNAEDNNDELEKPIIIFKKQNFGNDFIPPLKSLSKYNATFIERHQCLGVLQSFVPQDCNHIKVQLGDKTGLTPDWIFKVRETFIYIEVDSGSEKIKSKRAHTNSIIEKHDVSSIEGKLYRYEELAKKDREHNHKVIFALMDDSDVVITTNIHTNKDMRIANLKHEIAHMNDYNDWKIDVYATGMKRFSSVVTALYAELIDKIKSDTYEVYKDAFITLIKAGLQPNWKKLKAAVVPKGHYQSLGISTNNLNYIPDFLFRYYQDTENKYEQYFIPVFINEANVKNMEILAYYTIPTADGRFKYNAKILAIYKTKEALFNDVIRKTKKVTINKITKEIVDNNGMDTNNIIFVAIDELFEGKLHLYNADRNTIEKSQLF
ncbi:hypothetical protein [Bacillus paranthracis]|uniref:hypothetical protein n=1 Tax=Bacillus paranthracis TaxID=2026186 RepID=UPI0022E56F37|nr:hypothetical protein [Bacillus paranthracis]